MPSPELFVKMSLQSWDIQLGRATKLLDSLSDEQLLQEIAPGRNRGIYLFGHLVAIHDAMISLFGLGDRSHSDMDAVFLTSPDGPEVDKFTCAQIRQYWTEVHARLKGLFEGMSADSWFQRHNSMTDADFEKEPHRNKLNVLMNRSSHMAYHLGQLVLLKKS